MSQRVGIGYDVHRLVAGRRCVLGGVELDHETGPDGHSDGDAALHAIADSLLGDAGLADLGSLFPPSDAQWKDADSRELLREVVSRVADAGWRPVNVDLVIVTDGPRIAPVRDELRASIAALLGIDADAVNVKGKTTEGLGALSGGAGVEARAVCLLER
jgi:2-C-methyl-D-erythritol 2,4-cyclodiphosphate synthase